MALCLMGFVAVIFALSVVKLTRGDPSEAFDHVSRPALEQAAGDTTRLAPPPEPEADR